jgi:hypothetical protein
MAMQTALSLEEVRSLLKGETSLPEGKEKELPEGVRDVYHAEKRSSVERLCAELRSSLTLADKERIASLLRVNGVGSETREAQEMISTLQKFQSSFKK